MITDEQLREIHTSTWPELSAICAELLAAREALRHIIDQTRMEPDMYVARIRLTAQEALNDKR